MGVLENVIKAIFGTKADKDKKIIQPQVDKALEIYATLKDISNDELRSKTTKLIDLIQSKIASQINRIEQIRADLNNYSVSIEQKESLAKEEDKLNKSVNEIIESVLDQILPEAFAIVRETARRFTENDTIEVTATDFDRELASTKDFVTIEGDKAIYATHWSVRGNDTKWDMIHYPVQLFGGVVLHCGIGSNTIKDCKGKIAEMATGEGKTLVATLPVFLNALAKRGVHVVTVNDYLSMRDCEWMGPLYQFHGLSVDCINIHKPNSLERHKAYRADITFGTNNEFGFDYLRDNMISVLNDKRFLMTQRPYHHYAIVDEADSILIDDARTPLIISGPVPKGDEQFFEQYKHAVEQLYNMQRNLVTKLLQEAKTNLDGGDTKLGGLQLYRAFKGLPKYKPLIKYLSEPGIKVHLLNTEKIYMENNNRLMPEATKELYFVIDEKMNSVEITDKGHEFFSNYFKEDDFFVLSDIGEIVADLTHKAEHGQITYEEMEAKREEAHIDFSIKSERVHTVIQLLKAYAMFDKDVEYVVMDGKVKIVDEQTGRIMEGRRYSDGLHQAIEAKEGVKVEAATQTMATITLQNYFRLYHKLTGMTGTAETEAAEFWSIYNLDVVTIPTNRPIARIDMPDRVYKTTREKYNAVIAEIERIVNENRPVLVGTTSVEISELLSRMLKLRGIKHNILNAKEHQREAQIVAEAGRPRQVTIATNMAGRGTDIKLTEEVRQAGGLAIIGTERHDSRRVDRQLRGRAGRQGDPGSSLFFVSLEDNLMRLFGSERIAAVMDRLGHEEGEALQSGMLSKSIETAQKKVEEIHFGSRKRLVEYDDVMNLQRATIYDRRNHSFLGERIEIDLKNYIIDFAELFVRKYNDEEQLSARNFLLRFNRDIAVEIMVDRNWGKKAKKGEEVKPDLVSLRKLIEEYEAQHRSSGEEAQVAYIDELNISNDQLVDGIINSVMTSLDSRAEKMAESVRVVMERIYEQHKDMPDAKIFFPITDGHHTYNVPVEFKKWKESNGLEIFYMFRRYAIMGSIDMGWTEHLRNMDDMKQDVQNVSYAQKDPLVEYRHRAYKLFEDMLRDIYMQIISSLTRAKIIGSEEDEQLQERRRQAQEQVDMNQMQAQRMQAAMQATRGERQKTAPIKAEKKVGRNDPCPCGSGKKYKQCHGKGM